MKQRFGIAQALLGQPKIIIVDEPTAGLDPTERNRFHNLLSEIGENTIVILSTHIVEDVTNLCSDMAIICLGEVISKGDPAELVRELEGKIWVKTINKHELEEYQNQYKVINTQLRSGQTQIHVLSDIEPDPSFEQAESDLEDVYFARIAENMDIVHA
jgi:ABC-type multidrug transport system ATPase subunit